MRTTADAAGAFLRRYRRRRRRLEARLVRVNRAIRQWRLWEMNRLLPLERQRCDLREPTFSLTTLEDLRALLLHLLAELDS